jgi:hypothetical protein
MARNRCSDIEAERNILTYKEENASPNMSITDSMRIRWVKRVVHIAAYVKVYDI